MNEETHWRRFQVDLGAEEVSFFVFKDQTEANGGVI